MATRLHRFLVALVSVIALIAVSAQYARHDLGGRLHHNGHCDLCQHLSGTAGSPAKPGLPGRPVPGAYVARAAQDLLLPSRRKVGIYLPRGPPRSSLP